MNKTINNKMHYKQSEDFIDDKKIWIQLKKHQNPSDTEVRRIIQKSLRIQTLQPKEVAVLLNVQDEKLWQEMKSAAREIKRKVYDNRIVTFAPLYCSNYCLNNCFYCGFRRENKKEARRQLTIDEVKKETEILAGKIGHKRLIVVYGESPQSNVDYIAETIKAIYQVKVKKEKGFNRIRRVNVNAAPMSVEDLKKIKEAGIGTYQVFQETYHHETYAKVHPQGTRKHNYQWRLYCMHRAFEAGIDDVAIGALFGLYDWRFEVMGLQYHTLELEKKFNGIGPHTISFPRLQPAQNTPFIQETKYKVSDEDFLKLITVIRLAVPYTGMIVTARESKEIRDKALKLGCTQTDASTKIGIGAYSENDNKQKPEIQQFILGDTRSLDELVRDLAKKGIITSFCTAGYRCGRTGGKIMDLLRRGKEAVFCKINAILTYREWLDDFASEETKKIAEGVIKQEIEEIKRKTPKVYPPKLVALLDDYYKKIRKGERDLYV
ncbi:MAG: [FeFe] hydrogenase H-cluster radical SAM maturase HydG [Candidatus Moranbacteria bacterium]|nr:[FeFe] hydrogenase H-cluster radical SAM maturase HydG [Candidatus Moranbacteria bacterium]